MLLLESANLLYKESLLPNKINSSVDLIRTSVLKLPEFDSGYSGNLDKELMVGLKDLVIQMCNNTNEPDYIYNIADLIHSFKIIASGDSKLFSAIEDRFRESNIEERYLKSSITNIRRNIENHNKEQAIFNVLNEAYSTFKNNRNNIPNINTFIQKTIDQLEPLQLNSISKDPALIAEVDIGDDAMLSNEYEKIQKNATGITILKTGWQALNKMLQGGFRRGEFTVIGALQHKYKTGFSLSLFQDIALYNIPTNGPNKKPLLVRISFEDEISANLQFMYQDLKYNETKEEVDMVGVSPSEVSNYVKNRLQVNGYQIKMFRMDPTQCTYKTICNKIIELESQGYEIELLMLDYLGMLPTTGCRTDGPTGTPILDMFRRIRNFCSP